MKNLSIIASFGFLLFTYHVESFSSRNFQSARVPRLSNPDRSGLPRCRTQLYQSSRTETLTRKQEKSIQKQEKTNDEESNPFLKNISKGTTSDYTKGFLIIGFITFLNASCNPLWHAAFAEGGPPPLLMNAAVSVTAICGLLTGGPFLDSSMGSIEGMAGSDQPFEMRGLLGGMELGFWKFLGTTAHLFGLSLTAANHGAFLIQLTTLFVPIIQGLQGEKIPRQMQVAIAMALGGVYLFTQDPNSIAEGGAAQQAAIGDALCVAAAAFYSVYDINTFKWGKEVPRKQLVTTKVATQALLSVGLLGAVGWTDTTDYFAGNPDLTGSLIPVVLWSGLIVNALATFLQVGGMQAIGPTRAQTIFASQPLWSAMLSYAFLGEIIGMQGFAGGLAFLGALFLAATAPKEEPSDEPV